MEKKYTSKESKDSFRLNINLDRFRLELHGDNAQKCLHEINKILDKLNSFASDSLALDELSALDYKLENSLSDELVFNRKVTKMLNNFTQIYSGYKTNRISIENKKIIELESGKIKSQVELEDIQKGINKLLFKIPKTNVKQAVIHVKGNISDEEMNQIIDHIARALSNADVKKIFTKSDLVSHTIIEGVFFGEFNFDVDDELR